METHIEMDDSGGKPTIFGNIHMCPTYLYIQIIAPRFQSSDVVAWASQLDVKVAVFPLSDV